MKLIIAIVNSDDSSSVQAALTEEGEFFTPIMVDVLVGGATVFVLDIEQFEKF